MGMQGTVAFSTYAVINAITPGPGNILALNTMSNYGWKKGKRLLFGIFTGYYFVQILCAIFAFGLNQLLNPLMFVFKYVGAIYIAWLAVHIALSKPSKVSENGQPSFFIGFILQCVNVKIFLFGITALTGYIIPYFTSFGILLLFSLLIATMGSVATIIWSVFGVISQGYYIRYFRTVNIILAIILLECAYSLVFQ